MTPDGRHRPAPVVGAWSPTRDRRTQVPSTEYSKHEGAGGVPAEAASEATFGLEYDGPALANHEMDVRHLAAALLSVADMIQGANEAIRPEAPEVSVNIRATAPGSFQVVLHIAYTAAVGFLSVPGVTAASNLASLIQSTAGAMNYWKFSHRSENAGHVEPTNTPGVVRITFDGASIEVPSDTMRLVTSVRLRRDAAEILHPLGEPGIESIKWRLNDELLVEITKGDLPSFAAGVSDSQEILSRTQRTTYLTIESVSFVSGNKWRLSDGTNSFFAHIADKAFLDRIHKNMESFRKQDVLLCRVEELQWEDAKGLHKETEVMEVLEHRVAPTEKRLPGID